MGNKILLVSALLASVWVAHADGSGITSFVLPVMEKEPGLERFDASDWADADSFAMFGRLLWKPGDKTSPTEPRRATAYVGATDAALYLAVVSELPPDGKLLDTHRHELDVRQNDAVEFFLSADDPMSSGVTYQVLVAPDGRNVCKAHARGLPTPDSVWEKHVVTRSLVTDKDWIVILRTDLKLFPGRPLGETTWHLSCCRDWHFPFGFTSAPADFTGKKAAFRFRRGTPSVQFGFTEPPHLGRTVAGSLRLRNTAPEAKRLVVDLLNRSDSQPDVQLRKTLELKAGETMDVPFRAENLANALEYHLSVAVTEGAERLYARRTSWSAPYKTSAWEVAAAAVLPVDFSFAYYPTTGKLRLRPSFAAGKGSPADDVAIVVREQATGRSIVRTNLKFGDTTERMLDLPPLHGTNEVVMTCGKTTVVKAFERVTFPWEGNTIGKRRKVYPPFTPIVVDEGSRTLKTVLRQHVLGPSGLPAQIAAAGGELLAAPARLVANGAELAADFSVVERADDRVVTESRLSAGGFRAVARGIWECDGCLRYELSLQKGALETLTLEIPFKASAVPDLYALGRMRDIWIGKVPAGEGVVWHPRMVRQSSFPGFAPYIYLGSPHRGLAFWAENDRGWSWNRDTSNLEVVRKGETVVLRVNLVNTPLTVTSPRTIVLGLMAAPVKPRPPDWRTWWFDAHYELMATDRIWFGGQGTCGSVCPMNKDFRFWEFLRACYRKGYPKPTAADKADLKARIDRAFADYTTPERAEAFYPLLDWHASRGGKREIAPLFYFNRSVWNDLPEYRTFMNEWSCEDAPLRGGKPDIMEIPIVPDGNYLDYAIYYMSKSLDYANRAVYCDNYYARLTYNRAHPAVFADADGSVVPAAGIWGLREHSKRIFNMFNERGERPAFMPHMTSTAILPMLSFATMQLDWEWKYGEGPMMTRFPEEYFQLASFGELAGVLPVVLGDRSEGAKAPGVPRSVEATRVLFDLITPGDRPATPLAARLQADYRSQKGVRAWHYWDEGPLPVTVSDGVRWIAYARPDGRTVAAFVNGTGKALQANVRWTAAEAAGCTCRDYETGASVDAPAGCLSLDLPAYGMKVLECSRY